MFAIKVFWELHSHTSLYTRLNFRRAREIFLKGRRRLGSCIRRVNDILWK